MGFNHNGRHYVFPKAEWIPREWVHVVCTCDGDTNDHIDLDKTICRLCNKCNLIKRYYTSHCTRCGEFYIMAFKHPEWTPLLNYCWSCLAVWPGITKSGTPAQTWISPQVPKTREELATDLHDLLVIDDDVVATISSFFD